MFKKILLTFTFSLGIILVVNAQSVTKQLDNIEVSSSTAQFLGKSKEIRDLVKKSPTSKVKKNAMRRLKKVPENFKGKKPGGKSVHADLEHQGPDPIRQTSFNNSSNASMMTAIEPLVNIPGLTSGTAPNDPSGDVSDEFYVQAINVTDVGVYDLEGNLVEEFAMNTLWSTLNASSAGDPIILYDENAEKWFITEFTDPANLLIAVSETKDPLGAYNAYSFSTPNFPDYPKYAITPNALVVTTNEEGAGTLHQYFLDIQGLYAGASDVTMIRVAVTGNNNTEAGFYVTTPVDWNGTNMPYDDRPIAIAINDSSWPGGPAQDQIEIYAFNLDFDNPNNTTGDQTPGITTPFDSYPCSAVGVGFSCAPQMGGNGLDAIPEVIMNTPHLRNFGTHESMVFNFITDVTDGDNLSGIRWVELRRTAGTEWELYQEGTFSPDDGLDRYMGSIAIDGNGNIGLAYNVSSETSFVGVRFTGRYASDPLGEMTVDEFNVVDGGSTINSFGRFGDYSQMSVSPLGDNTFWFTTEYAASNNVGTRIVAFQLSRDTMDLTAQNIVAPVTSSTLGNELVTANFSNRGLTPLADYEIGFFLDNTFIQSVMISDTLQPDSVLTYQFSTPVDLSAIGDYEITAYINHPEDGNSFNDTVSVTISQLNAIDGGISSSASAEGCDEEVATVVTLTNLGSDDITSATIDVIVNGMNVDMINYSGAIAFNTSDNINYVVANNLQLGSNTIEFVISTVNGSTDNITTNNITNFEYIMSDPDGFVTLVFNTDQFAGETAWTINDADTGVEIATGSFEDSQSNSMISQKICLDTSACFTLTVTDSYGDGICCGYGQGNFSVLDADGNTLIMNDGNFGSEVTEEFCPSFECMLTASFDTQDATGADVNDGSIMITPSSGMAPYEFSIDGGTTFQSSEIFENLLPGDYDVVVTSSNGACVFSETVTVNFSVGVHFINGQNVEVKLLPNPTQGVFKVIISNLDIDTPLLNFEIFDATGKLIQERTIGKFDNEYIGTLSLYDYPSGNYFLRIVNKDVRILEKIVKID